MIPTDLLLAVCLVTAPAEAPTPDDNLRLRHAAQQLALEWELMDRRECHYTFTQESDFAADTKLIRRRYQDLNDAPPLCDAVRFPDQELCSTLCGINRAAYQKAVQQHQLIPNPDYEPLIRELDLLWNVWDTVRDTKCEYYYLTVRRQALKKLRDKIGVVAYYQGTLPAHLPAWYFKRID